MNANKLLALYHYCNQFHAGQASALYALGCRVSQVYRPSRSEEYSDVLSHDGYEEAHDVFDSLVSGDVDPEVCFTEACQEEVY